MHDLSRQQPRIPHNLREVPQSPLRAAGYEVVLTHKGVEHVTPYGPTVTKALENAEAHVAQHFPAYVL